eukprot:UN3717
MPPISAPRQCSEQPTPMFMLLVLPYGNPLVMLGSLSLPQAPSCASLALSRWEHGLLEVCVTEFVLSYAGEGSDCIRGGSLPLQCMHYSGDSQIEPPSLATPRSHNGSHRSLESHG